MASFAEILNDLKISYITEGHHHCRSGWIQLDCPMCGDNSHKYHLGYNIQFGYMNCWKCGKHNVPNILSLLSGKTWRDCRDIFQEVEKQRGPDQPKLHRLKEPKGIGPLVTLHKKYLAGRGLDWGNVEKLWGVQGIGIASRLKWRLYIPIHLYGNVVSWTTRAVRENDLRYVSASTEEEALPHKHLLYGEDYCRHSVIVHEGPLDVWRTGPGAVATFGTSWTKQQAARIAKYQIRVVCFDNETKAQQQAERLVSLLEPMGGETYLIRLDSKDAGSATDKEIRQLRKFLK